MGVQWGYKGCFGHKKSPANVDLQGIKKAAPTGFEFLSVGDTLLYHVPKTLKNKGFPKAMFPCVILCYTVMGVQWGYKGGTVESPLPPLKINALKAFERMIS